MAGPSVQDVSFYELVHKILTRPPEPEEEELTGAERRERERLSFPTMQQAAPIINGRMPKPNELRDISCQDISTTGISFYVAQPPDSDQLLVRLTNGGKVTHLTAQVMHCRPVADGGNDAFLLGCKFTGRADL